MVSKLTQNSTRIKYRPVKRPRSKRIGRSTCLRRLDQQTVLQMRNHAGNLLEVARQFNVPPTTTYRVLYGESYRDVGGPIRRRKKLPREVIDRVCWQNRNGDSVPTIASRNGLKLNTVYWILRRELGGVCRHG